MKDTKHVFVLNNKAEVPYMTLFLVRLGSPAFLDQDSQLSTLYHVWIKEYCLIRHMIISTYTYFL